MANTIKASPPMSSEYRPYDSMPAFHLGYGDYQRQIFTNPYDGRPQDGLKAQAWDRGLEFGSRAERFFREQLALLQAERAAASK